MRKISYTTTTTLAIVLLTCSANAIPDPESPSIFVKAGGSGDGTSWSQAFGSIQDALDDAVGNDTIWVAEGTYAVSGTTSPFEFDAAVDDVGLYGGFQVGDNDFDDRDPASNQTILTADIGTDPGDADDPAAAFPIPGASQDDSTIQDNARYILRIPTGVTGVIIDGLYFEGTQTTVNPLNQGIAIDFQGTASGDIEGCVIRYNEGGILVEDGTVTITRCDIYRNRITGSGAAIEISGDGTLEILDSTIKENLGGGLLVGDGNSEPTADVVSCRFIGNANSTAGGGICIKSTDEPTGDFGATIVNCMILHNHSVDGAGINITDGTALVTNCTIASNQGGNGVPTGGGSLEGAGGVMAGDYGVIEIDNSIIWNNETSDPTNLNDCQIQVYNKLSIGVPADLDYCFVQNWNGTDCTNVVADSNTSGTNPGFFSEIDPIPGDNAYGDYRLNPSHASGTAVDKGDDSLTPTDKFDIDDDWTGTPGQDTEKTPDVRLFERLVDGPDVDSDDEVDLGAYEFNGACSAADLDANGRVGPEDIALLLAAWGDTSSCTPCDDEDLDEDGAVDAADLAILLASWDCGFYDVVPSPATAIENETALTEADWDDFLDALGTVDEDCYVCWMRHYIDGCCIFCTYSCSMCSDPYGGH